MLRNALSLIGSSLKVDDELEAALRVFKGLQLARQVIEYPCRGCGMANCGKRTP